MALTRCRQAPMSRQEEARAPCVLGTAERLQLQRRHRRLQGQVGEEGKESGRRSWGQQAGVQQKQRRQEDLTPRLGCKVTVAVEGKKDTENQEYRIKRKIGGTLPCLGEEKGRQMGVIRGSPVSQREGADGLCGRLLVLDEEKVLWSLVSPATATAENLQGRLNFPVFVAVAEILHEFTM